MAEEGTETPAPLVCLRGPNPVAIPWGNGGGTVGEPWGNLGGKHLIGTHEPPQSHLKAREDGALGGNPRTETRRPKEGRRKAEDRNPKSDWGRWVAGTMTGAKRSGRGGFWI